MTVSSPTPIRPAARLRGRLEVPGDKSIAHRALIVSALSGGPASVTVRAPGRDILSTVDCLRALGARVDQVVDGELTRFSVAGRPHRDAALDCGNSGTTMRLLAGAIAGLPLRVTLDGDASLRARPMERVASLLRAVGADARTTDGHSPLTIVGRERLRAVTHRLPVASAQVLGATALAALGADGETRIEAAGPTRDHTERLLAAAGVRIRREGLTTIVEGPAVPVPLDVVVPGDFSSAAPWLVAGALHPDADLEIGGVSLNPTRTALVDLIRRMGARIEMELERADPEPVGRIRVRGGRPLTPVSIGGHEVVQLIDELPLVGIVMAAVDGRSELRDAAELRIKESDRIAAMVAGLGEIGTSVEERPDGWRISRGTPATARIETRGDHRIAIAFAVAALTGVASGVELDDADCVAVSYPTFWTDLAAVTR